ncbi:class I SAM-dependent methyltransferase [Metabacillus sediminilitoris]|uniref:Class I SAM-dependent methyltransferase n=1 Tax=Metabacillus sediminilitoris TaxID=2567941 RepID=A0A4S4BMT8_9BACI|nr:methyltransferase domain-containing protein [Metabacillus sediminilitoris]THF75957.1 class I SAM-dependent methyltransferase [Metabacillus sediminilitoris]
MEREQNGGLHLNYLNLLSTLGIGGAHPGGILLTKAIFENERFPLDKAILDAGCGTGQTASYLYQLGYDVTGLDKDSQMIEHAKKRNEQLNFQITYLNEDLAQTSIPTNTYDIILCESVLNFTSLQHTLPEVFRILKREGVVIAIEMVRNEHLTKEEEIELTTFYGCDYIFSIEEWKEEFLQGDLSIYKILSYEDLQILNNDEPTTEFTPIHSIPEITYQLLSEHERLTNKYQNKLSYRILFARKC